MTEQTRVNVQERYSGTADSYDKWREANPRGRLVSDHDIQLFNSMFPSSQDGMEVLEIGAGTGRFTLPVLEKGFAFTTTDINESMLESIRNKVEERGLADQCTIKVANIFDMDFEDSTFDFIFTIHVIPRFESLADQIAAINEISRVLKPGGKLFFNYSNKRSLWGMMRRKHTAKHTEMVKALEEAGLQIVRLKGKWIVNRLLINRVPLFVGRFLTAIDRMLSNFLPSLAWDVFIIAQKK